MRIGSKIRPERIRPVQVAGTYAFFALCSAELLEGKGAILRERVETWRLGGTGRLSGECGEPDDGNGRKVAAMSGGAGPGFDSGAGHLAPVQRASGLRLRGMGIGQRNWR